MFNNEKIAELQVVSVINFDVHLVKDFRGRRYIERITECVPIDDKSEYTYDFRKEQTMEGKMEKFMDNATQYFTKVTDRTTYKAVNILEYSDGEYVLTNKISDRNIEEMRINMDESDVEDFDKFIEKYWGAKKKVR